MPDLPGTSVGAINHTTREFNMNGTHRETSTTRTAALIDLENILIEETGAHHGTCAATTMTRLNALTANTPTRTAMGPRLMESHMRDVAASGWGVTLTEATPDAADHALLDIARTWIASGVTDLIIASGDHAFAELASVARLHVVSYSNKLSRVLRMSATSLAVLDRHHCLCDTSFSGQVAA